MAVLLRLAVVLQLAFPVASFLQGSLHRFTPAHGLAGVRTWPTRASPRVRHLPARAISFRMAWEELMDDESGLPYYHNTNTGETTWEKPQVEKPKVGGGTTTVFREGSQPQAAATGASKVKTPTRGGTRVVSRSYVAATASERPGRSVGLFGGGFFGGGAQGARSSTLSLPQGPPSIGPPCSAQFTLAGRAKGRPKKNQDATLVADSLGDGVDLFCVLDGHGTDGETVASWLTSNIPSAIQAALTAYDANTQNAVREAFLQLDAECTAVLGPKAVEESGATATVVLHKDSKLLVAALGDSRAILGGPQGKSKIQVLTPSHNPADPGERARILKSGGEVGVFPGEPSVAETGQGRVFVAGTDYPGLATARTFGDATAKTVGVSAEPSIQAATLGIGQVLIIATDGVWDVVEDSYAVELALYHQPDGQEGAELAAQELVQDARAIWEQREGSEQTIDDISAVVAFLP